MAEGDRHRVLLVDLPPEDSVDETVASAGMTPTEVPDRSAAASTDGGVDCVVAAWDLADGTAADLVGALADDPPVVALVDGDLSAVAPAAARAGLAAYLPRDGTDEDDLVATVRTAAAAHRERLDESRDSEMLTSLLDQVPLSVYFKDRHARIQRASRHMALNDPEAYIRNQEGKIHPHRDDLLGKTDWDLFAPEFAARTVADDRRVMESEEAIVNKLEEGTTATGQTNYTATTKAPRYDEDGNVIGLVGVTVDVTDREQHKRELQRQNDRLEEFAEVLTHDLRNPVNVALGYLELLQEDPTAEHAEQCQSAVDRIEQLIEEIHSFVVLGRTVEQPESVDLRTVATAAWSGVDTGGASLEVAGDLVLSADESRLQRLLENLYRNAVEHAGHDATVTVDTLEDGRGFAVADDGPGVPPEDRDRVFERGVTNSDTGTGFGLAIVADIAEAHGWSVAVTESDAGGARFEFRDVVTVEGEVGQTIH